MGLEPGLDAAAVALGAVAVAAILGFVAAVAGGLLGGMMGRALLPPGAARQRTPRLVAPIAWAAALATIVIAMPMASHPDYKATVTLTRSTRRRSAPCMATVRLDPPQAADNATWFNLTSWQGGNGMFHSQIVGQWVVPMHKVGDGVYQSTRPVPVYGKWKTLLRLATVNSLQALPVYMPDDPAIPAKGVAASPHFTRSFVADKKVLQREAVGGSHTLQRGAYALLALIGLIWMAGIAFGMRRLDRSADSSSRATALNGYAAVLPTSRSATVPGASRAGRAAAEA